MLLCAAIVWAMLASASQASDCYDVAVVARVRDERNIVPCYQYAQQAADQLCLGARFEMQIEVVKVRRGGPIARRLWVNAELASSLGQGLKFLFFLRRAAGQGTGYQLVDLVRPHNSGTALERVALDTATQLRRCPAGRIG